MYVYRASFTDKNGVKHYAKKYGKRAFRFWVDDPVTEKTPDVGAFSGDLEA